MKLLRILLFLIVPIYFLVTWFRNLLYDKGFKKTKSYDFPIICVGNLSTGGTGKSPMIEYLIRLLKDHKNIATLSRGYKRTTTGFVLADKNANAQTIGDEPFQFYSKYTDDIQVAVDANRQEGIEKLRKQNPQPEIILLDDAYQHRRVKAGLTILLTSYSNLYCNDIVLPTGDLREPRSGAKRANVIVVTKCPTNLTKNQKETIGQKLRPQPHQSVFFSFIDYSETIYAKNKTLALDDLCNFTLVTGIANPKPLVDYLQSKKLQFEHLNYPDHYHFKPKDISLLEPKEIILTTEKDFMRLSVYSSLKDKLFHLPIAIKIDNTEKFNQLITSFLKA